MSYSSKSSRSPDQDDPLSAFVDETPGTFIQKEKCPKLMDLPLIKKVTGMKFNKSKAVKAFRSSAVILLAGSTIILATVTFAASNKHEHENFATQYKSMAEQVFEGFNSKYKSAILSLDTLSIDTTSYAIGAGMTWPMVTIPDFAVKGWTARQQIGAETLGLIPLVESIDRADWEKYSIDNQSWIRWSRSWEESKIGNTASSTRSRRMLRGSESNNGNSSRELYEETDFSKGISSSIYTIAMTGLPVIDEGNGPFAPVWMTSPSPVKPTTINFNLLSHQNLWQAIESAVDGKGAVLSKVLNLDSSMHSFTGASPAELPNEPISAFYYPIFDSFDSQRNVVALLAAEVAWSTFFRQILPSTATGIICVVETSCGQSFTYRIDGPKVSFLGSGDLHDSSFDDMEESRSIAFLTSTPRDFAGLRFNFQHCPFSVHTYPTHDLEANFETSQPTVFAASVVILFFISAAIFFVYDNMKGGKGHGDNFAFQSNRPFIPPAHVKPRLKDQIKDRVLNKLKGQLSSPKAVVGATPNHFKATLSSLPVLNGTGRLKNNTLSNATVMFADVVGLERWSAGKEPEEKDNLLETVHRSLNAIAKRHGIFQVEMTGDCFVAIAGVQDSEQDHAALMAHFACDCRKRLAEIFKSMSSKNLSMRFGIHSGHVQAGSCGDESSRFQLFGDTVNTTFQMLAQGKAGKVHVSVETAELLNLVGKSHWLAPRKDLVLIKGKGEMSTYWVKHKVCLSLDESKELFANPRTSSKGDTSTAGDSDLWGESDSGSVADSVQSESSVSRPAIDRNVNVLLHYLKKIEARRIALRRLGQRKPRDEDVEIGMGDPIIEEAQEVVRMPDFDPSVASDISHSDLIEVSEEVESQLRLYVSSIASTYRDNEFHNFEHATHVTTTMDRIISKIILPDEPETYVDFNGKPRSVETVAKDLDARTFGIASDPLTQFALVFSTLVHDVDHVGVSNHQLVKEKSPIAALYKNKSVAEQNSVDIAWWLLMTPTFSDLRSAIYSDATEMRRFRQLLVNSVVATDILDRDMKIHRDRGWNRAFDKSKPTSPYDSVRDLQATLAVEHLMQAADAAHTMQSFKTYLKWSERIFEEMYQAYHSGRAEKDPSQSWYVGELAFFDKFVIPLATRLEQCGVLGLSGDEYLNAARENRRLWSENGKNIVQDMVDRFSRRIVAGQDDTVEFTS